MFKNILKKVFSKNQSNALRGVDTLGNKYFSEMTSSGERRWFESHNGELYPEIPAEWRSWLHHRRDAAPTPELSAQLEKIREQTRKNAQLWDEEMAQMNMRSGINDNGYVRQDGFDEIVKQLQSEADTTETTIVHRSPSDPTSTSFNKSDIVTSESDDNLSEKSVRTLAPKKDVMDAYHHTTHKAVDISAMSAEEVRDTLRAYSMSRTSRFLGVKPTVRSEARDALDQREQDKEKQNDQDKPKNE